MPGRVVQRNHAQQNQRVYKSCYLYGECTANMVQTIKHRKRTILQRAWTLAMVAGLSLSATMTIGAEALAQTDIREGKLQFVMLQEMANDDFTVLSRGMLADLETDSFFDGNFQDMFNVAATILDGYTPVTRGGYFPENAGIPREQQVTVAEAVYRLFRLDNGHELMIYRSPMENTSRYFIRQN